MTRTDRHPDTAREIQGVDRPSGDGRLRATGLHRGGGRCHRTEIPRGVSGESGDRRVGRAPSDGGELVPHKPPLEHPRGRGDEGGSGDKLHRRAASAVHIDHGTRSAGGLGSEAEHVGGTGTRGVEGGQSTAKGERAQRLAHHTATGEGQGSAAEVRNGSSRSTETIGDGIDAVVEDDGGTVDRESRVEASSRLLESPVSQQIDRVAAVDGEGAVELGCRSEIKVSRARAVESKAVGVGSDGREQVHRTATHNVYRATGRGRARDGEHAGGAQGQGRAGFRAERAVASQIQRTSDRARPATHRLQSAPIVHAVTGDLEVLADAHVVELNGGLGGCRLGEAVGGAADGTEGARIRNFQGTLRDEEVPRGHGRVVIVQFQRAEVVFLQTIR